MQYNYDLWQASQVADLPDVQKVSFKALNWRIQRTTSIALANAFVGQELQMNERRHVRLFRDGRNQVVRNPRVTWRTGEG